MATQKVLTGSVIELPFIFYDRTDGTTPIDVTSPTLKIYDSSKTLLSTTDITGDKVSTGTYLCYITIPDHTPCIYVEVSATNVDLLDLKREKINTYFSYDDMNSGTAPSITVGTNSYISYDDAVDLIPNIYNADIWEASTEDNRYRALILATKHIDSLCLKGVKVNESQALQFPRMIKPIEDINFSYSYGEINDDIELATVLEAIAILSNKYNYRQDIIYQGTTEIKVEDTSEKFVNRNNKLYSKEALEIMKPYISHTVKIKL